MEDELYVAIFFHGVFFSFNGGEHFHILYFLVLQAEKGIEESCVLNEEAFFVNSLDLHKL